MKRESYGRLIMTIGILLMVIAGAVGCSLITEKTQQEAQKIKKTDVKNENKDGEIMSKNPLTKETTPEFTKAVEKYYESLADKTDYIEGYEGIEVYKKEGLYPDTYLAFVRYGMKIKDIYTVVPGLGTLYVVKDGTSGTYQIHTEELDDRTEDYIETVAAHEDVQVMMEESRKEYQKAVQSDALLREALSDLKQAYEGSADSLE